MSAIVPQSPNSDNPIQVFNFGELPIRVVMQNGEAWFVAADVCKALDIEQVSRAMDRLDDDEKGMISNHTLGGTQEMWGVNQPGLYTLVLGSRKPTTKAFKRWIAHDVIPSINKTGGYIAKPMTPAEMLVMHAQAFLAHEQRITAIEQEQIEIRAELNVRNEHFTVMGFCVLKGLRAPTLSEASSIGKRCAALSRERGITIDKINDPRFGLVNIYHESILLEVIGGS